MIIIKESNEETNQCFPRIDSWFTKKEQVIEYDGRYCTSNCRREGCPHEELWAEHLKNIFDRQSYEVREKIIKYLSDNDFEDLVREIYDTHCSDCLGTGEVGDMVQVYPNEPHMMSDTKPCHCQSSY